MSKEIFWNPKLAESEIMGNAMERIKKAADVMADEVKKNTPVGTEGRPMYKTGPYKNKYWTARDAGALKASVRVTESDDSDFSKEINRNVWIMCGNTKAYYGKIIEFGINGNQYKGFFRKSINKAKVRAKNVLMGIG